MGCTLVQPCILKNNGLFLSFNYYQHYSIHVLICSFILVYVLMFMFILYCSCLPVPLICLSYHYPLSLTLESIRLGFNHASPCVFQKGLNSRHISLSVLGIQDGNPDVNSIAESEWTVVRSVLGIQLHVLKRDQSVHPHFSHFFCLFDFITVYLNYMALVYCLTLFVFKLALVGTSDEPDKGVLGIIQIFHIIIIVILREQWTFTFLLFIYYLLLYSY